MKYPHNSVEVKALELLTTISKCALSEAQTL